MILRVILSICLALSLCIVGCSKPPLAKEESLKNMRAGAENVRKSVLELDHALMADMSHPALVRMMGGRDQFIAQLTRMASEVTTGGFSMKEVVFKMPTDFIDSGGSYYAIIPFNLTMSGPGGAKGVVPSYLLAISPDGGRSWSFMDGAGIGGNRSTVKRLLPGFPDSVQLPAKQEPIWIR